MKEFKNTLGKSIIILEIALFIFLVLNYAYTNAVIEKTVAYRKYEMLDQYLLQNPEIKYAFFGSSHIENSVNPIYIDDSYNLAGRAMTYLENYYELKKLINDDVKIRYAFFELDMHTFSSYQFAFERPILVNLWHYSEIANLSEISQITGETKQKIWLDLNFPVIGKGENFFVGKSYSQLYKGYSKRDGNFTLEEITTLAKRRAERQFKNREMITNSTFEFFLKTIKLARDNNITVIFIKNPVSRQYDDELTKLVSKESYYDYIFAAVDDSIDEYYLLDYYNAYFDDYWYFSDADHLNYLGADEFSKKLSTDISTKFK